MVAFPIPFGCRVSPSNPTAPVPISATWLTGPDRLAITWDQLLQPGSSDQSNWIALHGGSAWQGSAPGVIAGSTTTVPMAAVAPVVGENCSYLAMVPDVIGLAGGLPAASFVGLPIT